MGDCSLPGLTDVGGPDELFEIEVGEDERQKLRQCQDSGRSNRHVVYLNRACSIHNRQQHAHEHNKPAFLRVVFASLSFDHSADDTDAAKETTGTDDDCEVKTSVEDWQERTDTAGKCGPWGLHVSEDCGRKHMTLHLHKIPTWCQLSVLGWRRSPVGQRPLRL